MNKNDIDINNPNTMLLYYVRYFLLLPFKVFKHAFRFMAPFLAGYSCISLLMAEDEQLQAKILVSDFLNGTIKYLFLFFCFISVLFLLYGLHWFNIISENRFALLELVIVVTEMFVVYDYIVHILPKQIESERSNIKNKKQMKEMANDLLSRYKGRET